MGDRNVTISTIESAKTKLRGIHTLDLGGGQQMDAILIPNLKLNLRTIRIPETWQHTYDTFADQDHDKVKAQILVGADKSTLFPIAEMDSNGNPIETGKCRLMRSRITNKLIPFGAYEDNQDHQEMMNTEVQIPQVQAGDAIDEILSSVRPKLAIPDVAPTDPNMDTE